MGWLGFEGIDFEKFVRARSIWPAGKLNAEIFYSACIRMSRLVVSVFVFLFREMWWREKRKKKIKRERKMT